MHRWTKSKSPAQLQLHPNWHFIAQQARYASDAGFLRMPRAVPANYAGGYGRKGGRSAMVRCAYAPNLGRSGKVTPLEHEFAPLRIGGTGKKTQNHSRSCPVLWQRYLSHFHQITDLFVESLRESSSRTRIQCRARMPRLWCAEVEWWARARRQRSLCAGCTRPQWGGARAAALATTPNNAPQPTHKYPFLPMPFFYEATPLKIFYGLYYNIKCICQVTSNWELSSLLRQIFKLTMAVSKIL